MPHVFEHGDHAPHGPTAQSVVHAWALHARVSDRYGHVYPPCNSCLTIEREREAVPLPHDRVHALHGLNADVSQWTGQGPLLHSRIWVFVFAFGQAAPPQIGSVFARLLVWWPLPHDMVHTPQGLNAPT